MGRGAHTYHMRVRGRGATGKLERKRAFIQPPSLFLREENAQTGGNPCSHGILENVNGIDVGVAISDAKLFPSGRRDLAAV